MRRSNFPIDTDDYMVGRDDFYRLYLTTFKMKLLWYVLWLTIFKSYKEFVVIGAITLNLNSIYSMVFDFVSFYYARLTVFRIKTRWFYPILKNKLDGV